MIKLMKSTFFNETETKEKLCRFIKEAEQLSMGEKCLEFENDFSQWQERKYSVMFNSGSSANLTLITALKNLNILKDKDSVGFSSLTWATNTMPLIQNNLTPVPIDISLKHLNIDLNEFENNKENIRALFLTNLLGFSGDIEKIAEICKKHNILLLEDNCESLGSKVNGKKLGNFSFASTFSFFVGHHMSTIEGGMVCTDNKELFNMLKMVRAHGWSRNLDEEKKNELMQQYDIPKFYDKYTFYVNGYNFRPMEINGFLGIEQLKYIDEMNTKREQNFKMFQECIKKNNEIIQLNLEHMEFISNFAFPLVFETNELFKKYLKKFHDAKVEVRPIVGGSMLDQPFFIPFKEKYNCPNAKKAFDYGFYFPNNPELTKEELNIICELLK